MKINKLTTNFIVKGVSEDDDSITITGIANSTSKDRMGDVIKQEAWEKGGLDNFKSNPILLAFHDHTRPIGTVTEMSSTATGLEVTAVVSKAAGDVYNLVKQGILKAFSVGFLIKDATYDGEKDIFFIKDVELLELSIVSVPANQDSVFSVAKSFEDKEAYQEYKNSFINEKPLDDSSNKKTLDKSSESNEEETMDLTKEQIKALEAKAVEKAMADLAATEKANKEADERTKAVAVEAATTGAERLIADIEKRFEEKDASVNEALEGLRTELKEKNEEIISMQKSKMTFEDKGASNLSNEEIDKAVLLSKIMGRSIQDTKFFKDMVAKAGDHLGGSNADNYETEFSTRMYDAIKDRLVIEPLFGSRIVMTSRSMVFPFNPEAGHANWVADTAYKSTNNDSSGVARTHEVSDITLKAEKLATKEAIGYEEDEDSIIPILPIIQAAVGRRMARTTDLELLRGDINSETVSGQTGTALINGISTLAGDSSTSFTQSGTYGNSNPITVSDLQQTRRAMGVYGMLPSDITYVVNQDVYFDLMDDPDFRTLDMVGSVATILTGQIGTVNGSPVIVSDAFAAPGAGVVAAIAVNTSNYLFGELRGITTERDRDVLNQKNWLVSTRRFAFSEIVAGASSTSNLVYGS